MAASQNDTYCKICNQHYKTRQSLASHFKTKKHLDKAGDSCDAPASGDDPNLTDVANPEIALIAQRLERLLSDISVVLPTNSWLDSVYASLNVASKTLSRRLEDTQSGPAPATTTPLSHTQQTSDFSSSLASSSDVNLASDASFPSETIADAQNSSESGHLLRIRIADEAVDADPLHVSSDSAQTLNIDDLARRVADRLDRRRSVQHQLEAPNPQHSDERVPRDPTASSQLAPPQLSSTNARKPPPAAYLRTIHNLCDNAACECGGNAKRCYRCAGIGHEAWSCNLPQHCYSCFQPGHTASSCRGLAKRCTKRYSASVPDPVAPSNSTKNLSSRRIAIDDNTFRRPLIEVLTLPSESPRSTCTASSDRAERSQSSRATTQ